MFYAKSMYLGQIISADDDNLNYSSYKHLGLRCLSCGEEVYLKKGEKNQPHFAHFKILENSPQNCSFRVFSDDLDLWRRLTIHGKNQRRKIFNQYFLDIINNTYPDFLLITNEIKQNERYEKIVKVIKDNKVNIISNLKIINNSNEEAILKHVIVIEVIDYLCLDYRKASLLTIIKYLCHQKKNLEKTEDLTIACQLLVDFLIKVDWLIKYDYFQNKIKLGEHEINKRVFEQRLAPEDHKNDIEKANQFIAFYGNNSTIYPYNCLDYQVRLENKYIYLFVNNFKCPNFIAEYNFLSIPSYEFTYNRDGYVINNKDKKITLGEIKKYLNENNLSELFAYLSTNPYILGYEKKLDKSNNISELVVNFEQGNVYYHKKRLDKTHIQVNKKYNYTQIIKDFINTLSINLDSKIKSLKDDDLLDYEITKQKLSNKIDAIELNIFSNIDNVNIVKEFEKRLKELNEKLENLTLKNSSEKLEQIKDNLVNLTNDDINHVVNKLLSSIPTKDNTIRLNKLLGKEYKNTLKVTKINSRIEIKTRNGKVAKISQKNMINTLTKFITFLDQNKLKYGNNIYGFNYFYTKVNREDFSNPSLEKVTIPKNKLDPKILSNFDQFMINLCLENIDPNCSLPMLYPNKDNVNIWLKLNNNYLSDYGIEIIEIKP